MEDAKGEKKLKSHPIHQAGKTEGRGHKLCSLCFPNSPPNFIYIAPVAGEGGEARGGKKTDRFHRK